MRENEAEPGENVLTLDSDIAELERLVEFVGRFCELQGVPEEICYQLQIVLEELVINAIKHGGCEPTKGAIRLAIRKEGDEVSAVLSDSGVGFNPLDAPSPDLTKSLRDRPVGGLGIHLVRHLIPSIRYERRGGRNYLYLTKPVKPESGTVSPEEETYANGDGDNQS
jgi:anti-sigma regulatory factor (Ser/Thr protein kinase)